jgi:hypothetical protein
MAEPPEDEIAALRGLDPIDPASLPSADEPEAHALFERITMSDTMTEPAAAKPRRRGLWIGAAAAVAVLAIGGGVYFATDDDDGDQPVAADDTTPETTDDTVGLDPSLGMCIAYDLETLASNQFAFDGTVTAVEGDDITFDVNEWYKGGDADSATYGGASGFGGLTSESASFTLEPGMRLLVTGNDGFVWSCGYTQPYDEAVAAEWAGVFA